MQHPNRYIILADLFEYPDECFPVRVKRAQQHLDESNPVAASGLQPFTDFTAGATRIDMEELYTRTFDVQSLTTLDIGYVLFGDDYKRGEMLVNLNREHRECGNASLNCELSDHLPNVLRLLPKMKDDGVRDELVTRMLIPAVQRMIDGFSPEKVRIKNNVYKRWHKTLIDQNEKFGMLYRHALQALHIALEENFGPGSPEEFSKAAGFLKSVRTELEIEKE